MKYQKSNFINMKPLLKILVLLLTILGTENASAQLVTPPWTKPNNLYGDVKNRQAVQIALLFPTGCGFPTLNAVDLKQSAIYFDSCNAKYYVYNPKTSGWRPLADSVTGLLKINNSKHSDSTNRYSLAGPYPSLLSSIGYSEGFIQNIGSDTIWQVFRADSTLRHVANTGSIQQRFSYDGGLTWTTPTVVYNSSYDDRNIGGGLVEETNTFVIWFRRYDAVGEANIDLGYIYSTDNGATYSSFNAVSEAETDMVPFAAARRTANGSYMQLVIKENYAEAWRSYNGTSWTRQGVIYDERVSNPSRKLEEPYWAYVGSNRIILLARQETSTNPSAYWQYSSTDNGQTFSFEGRSNVGRDTTTRTAPFVAWDSVRNNVIAIWTQRHAFNTTGELANCKNDSFVVFINKPQDVIHSPLDWTQKISFPRPEPDVFAAYGYPTATQLSNGNWLFMITERGWLQPLISENYEYQHQWQFDLNYKTDAVMNVRDSVRYAGLIPEYNDVTGFYDYKQKFDEFPVRYDGNQINRGNSTMVITQPSNSNTILRAINKSGETRHLLTIDSLRIRGIIYSDSLIVATSRIIAPRVDVEDMLRIKSADASDGGGYAGAQTSGGTHVWSLARRDRVNTGDLGIYAFGGIGFKGSKNSGSGADFDIYITPTGDLVKTGAAATDALMGNGSTQTITSGTYTPTVTTNFNCSSPSPRVCQYLRVGNTVTVSGFIDVTVTAGTTSTEFEITLPVASNFSAVENCAGSGDGNRNSLQVFGSVANDRAVVNWVSNGTGSQAIIFTFTYRII